MHSQSTTVFAGIDVSKDVVDFFFLNGKKEASGQRPRTPHSLAKLASKLVRHNVRAVVMEATGGLELPVWEALEGVGIQVVVANPKRVRDFARSMGFLAKTDKLDARVLALYGERMKPRITSLPSPEIRELRALMHHLGFLVDTRAQFRTRIQEEKSADAVESMQRMIEHYSAEIAVVEKQIEEALNQLPDERRRVAQLQTAPGVGVKTAWALVAELPELGQLSGREVAAIAGLAPVACESGKYQGKRRIAGGRSRLRKALYMAARAAHRSDPHMKEFRERILAKGKPKQVAVIAVARKLLVALNAMARDQNTWIPQNA